MRIENVVLPVWPPPSPPYGYHFSTVDSRQLTNWLTYLCTNDIYTLGKGFGNMLGVPDHLEEKFKKKKKFHILVSDLIEFGESQDSRSSHRYQPHAVSLQPLWVALQQHRQRAWPFPQ